MAASTPITGRGVHGLTYAVLGWAVAYGGVRQAWTVGEAPEFGRLGLDLLGFTGWWSVLLCAAAGGLAVALEWVPTWRPALAGLAWTVAGSLVAAAAILLPELVGFLLFTVGPHFDPAAFASRLGCVTGAVLLALATARYQRRTRGDCPDCCRTVRPGARRSTSARWARWAAYAVVGGLVTRFAAQFVVGFDNVDQDASVLGLEIGLVLAGVLLPLALVHHWGEIWPGWVPLVAGRTIPRLLLLVPGFGLGAGIVAYFGMGMVQVISGSPSEFSDAFLWVAISAYLVMGLGLVVASTDYHLRTRGRCGTCGR
ncbi:hypothetical protein [Micromonospora sp. DH14]|uniref:hypothetical protein n=1 Tax=Micromonospora sp. DH14 TaxID=3040120 RepID=UPI0024435981|nr:hypothetical protein [Micromonospora sp. DH14]MDG9678973.1 hypothetical protein [Micromonospora sp. DH14]